jgi:hypothetical protein
MAGELTWTILRKILGFIGTKIQSSYAVRKGGLGRKQEAGIGAGWRAIQEDRFNGVEQF